MSDNLFFKDTNEFLENYYVNESENTKYYMYS